MPRHPHIHAPGLLYHLMARGNNGQAVFLGPADSAAFLTALQLVAGMKRSEIRGAEESRIAFRSIRATLLGCHSSAFSHRDVPLTRKRVAVLG